MSTTPPDLEKRYAGRRDSAMVVNVSLDRGAVKLLRQYSDSPRAHGRFLSQLLYEHDRCRKFEDFLRQDGRKQLRKLCKEVMEDVRRETGT